MGHCSEGVVTATGVMVWPGWVGVMTWFMMISTSDSCQVGQAVPHTSRAVVSDDGESDGSATATPGTVMAANPTPSVTANAPTRPMYLPVLIAPSLRRCEGGTAPSASGQVPLGKSSLRRGVTNAVAHHCNPARR
jgi:hypothetical protein